MKMLGMSLAQEINGYGYRYQILVEYMRQIQVERKRVSYIHIAIQEEVYMQTTIMSLTYYPLMIMKCTSQDMDCRE